MSLYNVWQMMRQRCNNPRHHAFKNYGGRGISVCDRWSSFENFVSDMGKRPEDFEIDRIDVDGNYEPLNCQWVSGKEQQRNKRNSLFLTFQGRTQCLSAWAEELGFTQSKLYSRVVYSKLPLEIAFSTKKIARAKKEKPMKLPKVWPLLSARRKEVLQLIFVGKTNAEIADILGISPLTVKNQIQQIITKLGAYTRTGAVYEALRRGLIEPPERIDGEGRQSASETGITQP